MNTSHQNLLSVFCVIYTPDEGVRFILCAPSFGAAGFAPRPLATDRGFALVEGGGAAIAAHGSSSSTAALAFTFIGFETVLGAGAAMEPHESSCSFVIALAVFFELKLVATN